MYVPEEEEGAENYDLEAPDTDLVQLPSLDSDDVSDEEEETPDKEPEAPVEPDEKFSAYFEKQTGMPMQEFSDTLREIQTIVREVGANDLKEGIAFIKASRQAQAIEDVRNEADAFWDVTREETVKRLTAIQPYFNKLSKEDKKLYDTVKGADILWRSYLAERGDNDTKTKTTKSGTKTGGRRFLYTQQDIDSMSSDEYKQNADRITYAYTNGLVGE